MTTATETIGSANGRCGEGPQGRASATREAAPNRRAVESRRARGLCGHRLPGLLDGLHGPQARYGDQPSPTWFSTSPTLDHFRDAINRAYFWDAVKNSLIIVGVTVVLSIVLAFLAAIALAKYRFTGRSLFVVAMIGILMLPQVGLVIPLYVVLAKYHLTSDDPKRALTAVIITYMTFLLPFAVLDLRGFLLGIPKELEESAMVDGSSRLGAFLRSCSSSHPAWSRLRCSSSSQPGTSTSSPTFF